MRQIRRWTSWLVVFYWRYLRSRAAAREHLIRAEYRWSGKTVHPDDLEYWLNGLRGGKR